MKDAVAKEQQTSTPLNSLLFSTWSVFFWYTFVFVIAAKKNAITYGLVFVHVVFTILCSYSVSGWTTEAFSSSFCVANPFDTWAQNTKPKACCHLLELAVTASNIFVKLSHIITLLADDLTISRVSSGYIMVLVNLTVRWRCTKRASRFSTIWHQCHRSDTGINNTVVESKVKSIHWRPFYHHYMQAATI